MGSLSSLFSLSFPWQEKASLSACLATAAYLGFALGLNVDCAGPRRKWQVLIKDPEWLFALGSYAFLFLYTAATALCQRTSMGTVGGSEMIVEIYRDLGLALLAFCLIVLTRLLVKASSFNGMIVRKDVERAYRLLLGAAGALAICFATWFPLIALPGAWIMTKWCLGILAAIETTHEDEETGEDEVRKPALS